MLRIPLPSHYVCARILLQRKSFQAAAGMLTPEPPHVHIKDTWHHQPAQLSAITFAKDKEGVKGRCIWSGAKIQLMPSICSSTHRAQVQAEQRTLCVSAASLNSFTLYRMKSHSEQSYHHHTSVKMEKHSQPLSLLRFRLFQNNCYPPTDCVLQMKEKSSFSFPKGVPSLLQLGLSRSLGTRGGVTTKEELHGDHIIAIWAYRNYPNWTWAPHPEALALSFRKVLPELQLQWTSQQGCWKAWSVDKGRLIHSLIWGSAGQQLGETLSEKYWSIALLGREGASSCFRVSISILTFMAPGRKAAGGVCTGWGNMEREVHCSSRLLPFCHWRLFQWQKSIPIMCFMENKVIHYTDKNGTQHCTRCWAEKSANIPLHYLFRWLQSYPFLGLFYWISSLPEHLQKQSMPSEQQRIFAESTF